MRGAKIETKRNVQLRIPGAEGAQARADQKRIRELERELQRKEKALAEAAALLILQKKLNALWGSDTEEN